MNTILDFNNNGGAIIEILQIDSDYSLVINHWVEGYIQLQEIKQNILQSDSPERTSFLKKYAEELKQTIDFEDMASERFNQVSTHLFEEDCYESEEERLFYKKEQSKSIECICSEDTQCLKISNFKLKHSLAWYLPNRIDNEIKQIDQNIEIQKGFIEPCKSLDKTIKIIRNSQSEYQAVTELMKQFSLSELQAKAIVNISIREIGGKFIESRIYSLEFKKAFLEKLK